MSVDLTVYFHTVFRTNQKDVAGYPVASKEAVHDTFILAKCPASRIVQTTEGFSGQRYSRVTSKKQYVTRSLFNTTEPYTCPRV